VDQQLNREDQLDTRRFVEGLRSEVWQELG
jgi:hypothetical protein